jgi:hypothetical protein
MNKTIEITFLRVKEVLINRLVIIVIGISMRKDKGRTPKAICKKEYYDISKKYSSQ